MSPTPPCPWERQTCSGTQVPHLTTGLQDIPWKSLVTSADQRLLHSSTSVHRGTGTCKHAHIQADTCIDVHAYRHTDIRTGKRRQDHTNVHCMFRDLDIHAHMHMLTQISTAKSTYKHVHMKRNTQKYIHTRTHR